MAKSLVTTVATPSKWPGRDAPSQAAASGPTDTTVEGGSGQSGYISVTPGAKTTSTPRAAQTSTSLASVRGYRSRSAGSPNCSGLTKTVTQTVSHSDRARMISDSWPAWSAPIVGTSPTRPPPARASSRACRQAATEWSSATSDTRPHRRLVDGRLGVPGGRRAGRGLLGGQAVGQRHPGEVPGPLLLGEGAAVALEGGPVAAGGRAGERPSGPEPGDVVERGPRQRQEHVELEAGRRRDPLDLAEQR